MVEQGKDFPRVFLRQPDDGFPLNHSLRLLIRGLHYELVDGGPQKLGRLLQRHAHVVRNAGGYPLAKSFHYMFHDYMVPLCHRLVNGLSTRQLSLKRSVKALTEERNMVASQSEFPSILQGFLLFC